MITNAFLIHCIKYIIQKSFIDKIHVSLHWFNISIFVVHSIILQLNQRDKVCRSWNGLQNVHPTIFWYLNDLIRGWNSILIYKSWFEHGLGCAHVVHKGNPHTPITPIMLRSKPSKTCFSWGTENVLLSYKWYFKHTIIHDAFYPNKVQANGNFRNKMCLWMFFYRNSGWCLKTEKLVSYSRSVSCVGTHALSSLFTTLPLLHFIHGRWWKMGKKYQA